MLLLLHLQDCPVVERPLHNIGIGRRALDEFGLFDGGPEVSETLELDVVPDVGEGGLDDGRFDDAGAGGDSGHGGLEFGIGLRWVDGFF